uniref:CLIP domain-containing serine protease n=1 Tax=Macrobrachium rosenbergii TaxID=79674 RepID=H8XYP4_MACRS|nr:prophenoloxide activating enzyme III [Macrobrachium rosenbergii]
MKTYIPGLLVLTLALLAGNSNGQRGRGCITANGGQGSCIPLANCEHLRTLPSQIQAGIAPLGSQLLLRRSICHIGPREFLVCCGPTAPVQPDPFSRGSPVSSCGIQGPINKIVGGEAAPLRAWPWMVVLRGNIGGRSFWFCGGTLISSRFVLTAAHCFKKQLGVTLEFARIGEHNLITERDCDQSGCSPPPQDIPVERVIMHPDYGLQCAECNDIALLKLSRDAVIDNLYVTPICLPEDPVRDMGYSVQQFVGQVGSAAGWGTTARDPTVVRRPATLHEVDLPIHETPFCQALKGSYPNKDMVICAGGEGKDTCKGDSGGPLTLTNNKGTRHFIVGITSRGPLVCGSEDTQGLYTSVHHYLPWIQSTMRS